MDTVQGFSNYWFPDILIPAALKHRIQNTETETESRKRKQKRKRKRNQISMIKNYTISHYTI